MDTMGMINLELQEVMRCRQLRQAMLEMLSEDLDKLDENYQLHPVERTLAERLAPKLAAFMERQDMPDPNAPAAEASAKRKK